MTLFPRSATAQIAAKKKRIDDEKSEAGDILFELTTEAARYKKAAAAYRVASLTVEHVVYVIVRRGGTAIGPEKARHYLPALLSPLAWLFDAASDAGLALNGPQDQAVADPDGRAAWIAFRASEIFPLMPFGELAKASENPRRMTSKKLGELLNVTFDERAEFKLYMIAPCDMTVAEFETRRQADKRQGAKNRRRANNVMPRQDYLARCQARAEAKPKPWATYGVSERTWSRWKKAGKLPIDAPQGSKVSSQARASKPVRGSVAL